jgi:methionyl-tRNA formyltransferase
MDNNNCKIIFMGTPDFAVPILDAILKANFEVTAVVTSPDKYGGRGKKQLLESSVKKFALSKNLTVLQPTNLKDSKFINTLQDLKPTLQIVVAFRMLPKEVWKIPELGTVNLHASLLPAYRGAAPINWAIIKGEKITGVTTFLIDEKIDTGAILLQSKVRIEENDTAGILHDKLMDIGAKLVVQTIQGLLNNTIESRAQDSSGSSLAPKIFREDCKINFNMSSSEVHNFIRGLSPYPGAWAIVNNKEIKIYKGEIGLPQRGLLPGSILTDNHSYFSIATSDGSYKILELQIPGRKKMNVIDFIRGNNLQNILK